MFNSVVERKALSSRHRKAEEQLSQSFQALADPSRRRIIELLRETQELKVGDIAEAFSMSLNGVSKHLKILEQAGLVTRRISGRQHWIRVSWSQLQAPYQWLHFYQHFWSTRLDALVDYVQKPSKKQNQ